METKLNHDELKILAAPRSEFGRDRCQISLDELHLQQCPGLQIDSGDVAYVEIEGQGFFPDDAVHDQMVVIVGEMLQIHVAPKHSAIKVQRDDGRLSLVGDKRHDHSVANERRVAYVAAEVPLITVDDDGSSDGNLHLEPICEEWDFEQCDEPSVKPPGFAHKDPVGLDTTRVDTVARRLRLGASITVAFQGSALRIALRSVFSDPCFPRRMSVATP